MSGSIGKLIYGGSTPGADSNTYNLVNTVTSYPFGARALQGAGIHKILISIKHSAAGTVNWYKSQQSARSTFVQMGTQAISAPGATAGTYFELLVEDADDVKIDWVNGGSAQTSWMVDIALVGQRAAST